MECLICLIKELGYLSQSYGLVSQNVRRPGRLGSRHYGVEFLLVNKSRISQWEGGGRKPQTRERGARRYLFSHAAVFIATAPIPF